MKKGFDESTLSKPSEVNIAYGWEDTHAMRLPSALVHGSHLLYYLSNECATGVFTIQSASAELEIYFKSGVIIGLATEDVHRYCQVVDFPFSSLPHDLIAISVRRQQNEKIPFFCTVSELGHQEVEFNLEEMY